MKALMFALWSVVLLGCQDDITTPFPTGLEPLEDNVLDAEPDGPFDEGLRVATDDSGIIKVYARGFVDVPFDAMWAASKDPTPNLSTCSTDEQHVTISDEPQYELSFVIHYVVHNVLTVEWDDAWRFGRIDPGFGMIRHQKVQGSDFITLSEGTIEVLATANPDVSELAFVEHLDATQAGTSDVVKGVKHNYAALVAVAHGTAIPPCP